MPEETDRCEITPSRETYAKLHANTSGPSHQGQTSTEAQAALDEIDRLRDALHALHGAIDPMDFVRVMPGERLLNAENQHEVFFNTEPHAVVVICANMAVFDAYDKATALLEGTA